MQNKLIIFLTIFLSINFFSYAEDNFKTKNVIIVVIDGPRYSETWGEAKRKYIPKQNALAKFGTLYTQFFNKGKTLTIPGHYAMISGYYENVSNSGKQIPQHPSLFQKWLKASAEDNKKAWIIASKGKLAILTDAKDESWSGQFQPKHNCGINGGGIFSGYREDRETWIKVLGILKLHHPRLVLINFKEPDVSGHNGDMKSYFKGIRDTDRYIAKLWNILQHDSFYKGQTALFITNDHGRHLDDHEDGIQSHGDDCLGCQHISLLALGPDFRNGVELNQEAELIDIAVTIAKLLGLDIPDSEGRVLEELLIQNNNQ